MGFVSRDQPIFIIPTLCTAVQVCRRWLVSPSWDWCRSLLLIFWSSGSRRHGGLESRLSSASSASCEKTAKISERRFSRSRIAPRDILYYCIMIASSFFSPIFGNTVVRIPDRNKSITVFAISWSWVFESLLSASSFVAIRSSNFSFVDNASWWDFTISEQRALISESIVYRYRNNKLCRRKSCCWTLSKI